MNKKNKPRRGIALIHDPHNLYQFIWYYCTYGMDYEWTALCLPNGYKGEYMSEYCKKSGIFKNIIRDSQDYLTMPILSKMKIFLHMLLYAIIGQQTVYCKKLISKYVQNEEYDTAVVLTDSGIISGAFIALGKEKKIVILEDGSGDYVERPKGYILRNITHFHAWQGFLLAKMGYSCPSHRYMLKPTQYCEKYCSNPEQMLYRNYKSMNLLFDMSITDSVLFKDTMQKVYQEIKNYNFGDAEVVIFTDRLGDFTKNPKPYLEKFQNYINKNYKSVILKKHPRDEEEYLFEREVNVQIIDSSIPAEVLLPYLQGKEILFLYTSSIMIYMKGYNYKVSCLYFNNLFEASNKDNAYGKYMNKKDVQEYIQRFGLTECKIVEI